MSSKKESLEIKTNPIISLLLSFIKWAIIIFIAAYTLLPLLWLLIASLKTNVELISNPFGLPLNPQFRNYANAFEMAGLGRLFFNSVYIAFFATILNVLVSAMSGYVISRYKSKMNEIVYILLTVGVLVPLNALMVPIFILVNRIGFYDRWFTLIIVYTALNIPISTFIIRGFMESIPVELEEAATLDGCGFYKKFYYVILPLSTTGLVTAATFQFLFCWNEFVYSMLLTSSQLNRTVQLGVRYFTNQFTTDYPSMYAAIVITIIPTIVVYMLFQEQIVSGLTSGSVKG